MKIQKQITRATLTLTIDFDPDDPLIGYGTTKIYGFSRLGFMNLLYFSHLKVVVNTYCNAIFSIKHTHTQLLLHPTYFPSIAIFSVLIQNDCLWEAHDNFQKQTYRNRCYICTDQGKHRLNIPIQHVGGEQGRQKYRDVVMDNAANWKKVHWRTLETAYRASPFFEFYEDDLQPLFEDEERYLYSFVLKALHTIGNCLGIQIPDQQTGIFEKNPSQCFDARFLVEAKKEPHIVLESYAQVFGERHGFVANLSILDLLFSQGPNALDYLKRQPLDFLNR